MDSELQRLLRQELKSSWDCFMWLEKLSSGVLRVLTPLGPRYLNPSLAQRLYLIWVFRHFETLPVKVLSSRQRRMIESGDFVHDPAGNSFENLVWQWDPVCGHAIFRMHRANSASIRVSPLVSHDVH